jgi:uncharacterized protein
MGINDIISDGTILLGYRGSIAHGMYVSKEDPDSIDDKDYMGVVLPPKDYYIGLKQWGSRGTKEIFEGEHDLVEYEIKKFVNLLLKSNPNVISLLWLKEEFYLKKTRAAQRLIDNRQIFTSRIAINAFCGYASAQLKKMGKFERRGYRGKKREELISKYGYDTKNAAHCMRLLRMCIEYIETGEFYVWRGDRDAEELLEIKRGKWNQDRVLREASMLFDRLERLRSANDLPDKPNYEAANELVSDIIQEYLFQLDNKEAE